ncbi:MAG: rhodanese-related sulfurtransferase [Hymenobacteraceae bacterium]|nr:rhodanese-related sulfurtransferase [Hymenobacteraceae bacterium]MDX5395840.1 rhodanese-related sulfurtransferase [Hymenobacteraceae bacterium]MDX5511895.1 rhodanese-related sulfurtransferase [Hymenobacteraceae bacterium]
MNEKKYSVLLYYCYTPIEDPEQFREEHHLLCLELNLLGRIVIAAEGLNGTVSGLKEDCEKYMQLVKADPRFSKIDFKVEAIDGHAFTKLHVRHKPEIVHSSLRHIDPNKRTGVHLEPEEFRKMKDAEDVVILDVRSDYEYNVGRFKNAVTLDIENFREFSEKVERLKEEYKDKKILTYCTGGIKCEKASAFLLEQGFENVYQLHGGIIKYGLEAGGEDFEGKCYVFDNRLTVDVNKVNPKVISNCFVCHTPNDRMVNCANPHCNEHVAICESCGEKLQGACSVACMENPDKRPYDGSGYYQKNTNGYNPYKGLVRRTSKEGAKTE